MEEHVGSKFINILHIYETSHPFDTNTIGFSVSTRVTAALLGRLDSFNSL